MKNPNAGRNSDDLGFNNPLEGLKPDVSLTRRQFFLLSGLSSGFAIGLANSITPLAAKETQFKREDMNAYVQIRENGDIQIYAPNPEVGQGVKTSLPMIVAEELDADWSRVKVVNAPVDATKFGQQFAGGSRSIPNRWDELRKMGATARSMLVSAAAESFKVPSSELVTANSVVRHAASGKTISYAELAELAAKQAVPEQEQLKYKASKDYRLLGSRITGADNQSIVTGSPIFGIDTQVPGMLFASYTKCPNIGGKPVSANLDEIKKLPGVVDAFILEGNVDVLTFDIRNWGLTSGVAIVAKSTWQAIKAKDALEIKWDTSNASKDDWQEIKAMAAKQAGKAGSKTIDSKGDISKALASAETVIDAYYNTDFVSHAQLEPQNCTVHYKGDSVEAWAPTQTPAVVPDLLADLLSLPKDKVTVHQIRGGGGFGRRLSNEYVYEAALISKHVSAPIKLQWTREDDMAFDYFRVGAFYSLQAGLDKQGRLNSWSNHVIALSGDGEKPNSGAGLRNLDFPSKMIDHYQVTQSLIPSKTPTGPWRAPSSNTFAFAEQSFIHELSVAAGRDHLEFLVETMGEPKWHEPDNMASLNTERAIAVIERVAKNADWGKKMPSGRALGLSFYFSHAGHIAEVAEVSVDDKQVDIHKVWVVADVGPIVNLSGAENQVQGSVIDAISTLANQKITMQDGQIQQSNFHQYPLLRTHKRPQIEVEFLKTDYPPTGLGEPAFPPLAAAVCNAIFSASGHRIRELPISNQGFSV